MAPASDNNNYGNSKRKRKRDKETIEKLQSYGIDLPDIPGLPVQIIPLHVHAIKSTTKYFKLYKDECVPLFVTAPDYKSYATTSPLGIASLLGTRQGDEEEEVTLENILDRVSVVPAVTTGKVQGENGNDSSSSTNQNQVEYDRIQSFNVKTQAMNAWLDAIYREVRHNAANKRPSTTIPVAAMQHLWDVLAVDIQNRSWALRRASHHLLGHLAFRSSHARQFLLQDPVETGQDSNNRWLEWMNNKDKKDSSTSNSSETVEYHCLQRESYTLLQLLEQKGYAQHYTSIIVLQRRMVQIWPHVTNNTTTDNNYLLSSNHNMVDWRQWRDLAIKHADKEELVLQKILVRCDTHLERLVPRMQNSNNNDDDNVKNNLAVLLPKSELSITVAAEFANDKDDDDLDDIGDVDWENGFDEDFSNEDNNNGNYNSKTDELPNDKNEQGRHEAAVNLTLSVLEASGRLREGGLTVDMSGPSTSLVERKNGNESVDARTTKIRNKLSKFAAVLKDIHLPRLSLWIQGVVQADQLIMLTSSTALVNMSRQQQEERVVTLAKLTKLKNEVTRTLAAIRKLGINGDDTDEKLENATNNNNDSKPPAEITGSVSVKLAAGSAKVSKKKRIKIKYN